MTGAEGCGILVIQACSLARCECHSRKMVPKPVHGSLDREEPSLKKNLANMLGNLWSP